jgi:hypothetical protein
MESHGACQSENGLFPPPPRPAWNPSGSLLPPESAGVYFVYESGECVYVGESVNLRKRISGHPHVKGDRKVGFMLCSPHERKRFEAFYIGLLDPKLNSQSSRYQSAARRKPQRAIVDSHYMDTVSRRMAARRRSVFRKARDIISSRPGLSVSEFHAAIGWKTDARLVRAVLSILREWRFIERKKIFTYGRPKEIIFLAARREGVAL